MNDLPNNWKKINGQQYCGDIKVDMKCKFTNKGDHCLINVFGIKLK